MNLLMKGAALAPPFSCTTKYSSDVYSPRPPDIRVRLLPTKPPVHFTTEQPGRDTPEQIAADLDVQIEKLKDSILELENKKAASATEFDNKIAAVKEKIAKLEAKKKDVLTPKKRKPRKSKADQIKLLVRQAQKSGMKLDEIADKLGMALPE